MNVRKSAFSALIAIFSALALAACSTPGTVQTGGSRSELYDSVQGIAADSALVALVEVKRQQALPPENQQDIPHTLSVVSIMDTFTPTDLAKDLPSGATANAAPVGSELVVRQMGTDAQTPAPILKPGQRYLLFLTPSALEGEAATQFYITGGSAGIYDAPADARTGGDVEDFTHGPFVDGDTLPTTLNSGDLSK